IDLRVPRKKVAIFLRDFPAVGQDFCSFPRRVVRVARPEKPSHELSCCEQHSITSGVRGTIGHAMLESVHANTGTKGGSKILLCRAKNYFINCEVVALREFSMQQGSCDPDLVSNF